jgi:hypothetical protein
MKKVAAEREVPQLRMNMLANGIEGRTSVQPLVRLGDAAS